jgi:glycosyltransferase involved in cell wall biosynthesis
MKGSPLKIYTYLAAGRPIVASDFAEAGMLVQKIGAGIAVPPERPDLLAEAIGYVLNHPEEAGAMGKAGRKVAEDRHGWQVVAGQIVDICRQVQRA